MSIRSPERRRRDALSRSDHRKRRRRALSSRRFQPLIKWVYAKERL